MECILSLRSEFETQCDVIQRTRTGRGRACAETSAAAGNRSGDNPITESFTRELHWPRRQAKGSEGRRQQIAIYARLESGCAQANAEHAVHCAEHVGHARGAKNGWALKSKRYASGLICQFL